MAPVTVRATPKADMSVFEKPEQERKLDYAVLLGSLNHLTRT
jgi:hypothetical protein